MKLKMGTRGSPLALAQSGQVARLVERLKGVNAVETVVIKTSGDLFSAAAPREAVAAGGKGLFVKEIEEALVSGRIDFAVHSAKDLPADLAPGLVVAAYPEREDPRDAFIGRDGLSWQELGPGARVATSSLRRKAQLQAAKPGVEVVPMRGNVDTRLRKLLDGACEGLLLAGAGLRRLGRGSVVHELVPLELMLPAPGQGALAIETRADRGDLRELLRPLDHPGTRLAVELERCLLKAVGGGCATPLGALAQADGSGQLLSVFWASAEGGTGSRFSEVCPPSANREAFCAALAAKIRAPR